MKLAFAGKGGAGKTTLCAWTADYLARQGRSVWMVDADTALSLGQASGLSRDELPTPLALREDLVNERIGRGFIHLTPEVGDLPESLAVDLPVQGEGRKRLLVMGNVAGAGGGCACSANALLKALLAHLVLDRDEVVLVDLEAGVEHLGRGTVQHVDGLAVVTEPSRRSLETAAEVGRLATDLGLARQLLVLNRMDSDLPLPDLPGLPEKRLRLPMVQGLVERQLTSASVVGLPEQDTIDAACRELLLALGR
jgi:CO dehydrogenase maturation factor